MKNLEISSAALSSTAGVTLGGFACPEIGAGYGQWKPMSTTAVRPDAHTTAVVMNAAGAGTAAWGPPVG